MIAQLLTAFKQDFDFIPEVGHFGQYRQQDIEEDISIPMPCILIEFNPISWAKHGVDGTRSAELTFTLHILSERYREVNEYVECFEDELAHAELVAIVLKQISSKAYNYTDTSPLITQPTLQTEVIDHNAMILQKTSLTFNCRAYSYEARKEIIKLSKPSLSIEVK